MKPNSFSSTRFFGREGRHQLGHADGMRLQDAWQVEDVCDYGVGDHLGETILGKN